MVKIQDPTAAFAEVVSLRRQSRAETDGEKFRLGFHGLDCGPAPSGHRRALVGASAWALKTEHVADTMRTVGLAGGLLTDLGFKVCPIGAADAAAARPSLIVWVCGDETQADEYSQLHAIGVPGLSLGSCVDGLDAWSYIESDELDDRARFIRLFVDEIEYLVGDENVSNKLSNERPRTGRHDGERTASESGSDLH